MKVEHKVEHEPTLKELETRIEAVDQATRLVMRAFIDRLEMLETKIIEIKLKQDGEQPK